MSPRQPSFYAKWDFKRTPVHIQWHFHRWPTMLVKVGNTDPSASFINAPVDSYWYSCTMLPFSSSEVIKSILIMRCRKSTKHRLTLCFQKDSFCYITRFTFWLLCIRQLPHNVIIKQTFHMPTSVWWTNWLKSLSQNLYTTFIFSSSDSLFDIYFPSYPVNQILNKPFTQTTNNKLKQLSHAIKSTHRKCLSMQATKLRCHEIRHGTAHTNATCVSIFDNFIWMWIWNRSAIFWITIVCPYFVIFF